MPNVQKGESKQKFLKRCTPILIGEGRKADQAYAICNSMWDKSASGQAGLEKEDNENITSLLLDEAVILAPQEPDEDENQSKARIFQTTAYAGQAVDRWWGKLILDIEGMNPAKNSIPIFRNHDTDRIVGHSTGVWKDETHFYVSGEVSNATKDSLEVIALADEGFPWQASVRARALRKEILETEKETADVNGKTVKGPMEIWRETVIEEVSFVPFGADDRTAGIVMSDDEIRQQAKLFNIKQGDVDMDKQELIETLMGEGYGFSEEDKEGLEKLSVETLQNLVDSKPNTEEDDENSDTLAEKDAQIATLTAQVENQNQEISSLRKTVEDVQTDALRKEIRSELDETGLGMDLDDTVPMIVSLKALDDEIYLKIMEILKAAGVALKAAGTFEEEGTNTSESSSFSKSKDAYDALQEKKEAFMAENPEVKERDAWFATIRKHSKLYREYNTLRDKEAKGVIDDDEDDVNSDEE